MSLMEDLKNAEEQDRQALEMAREANARALDVGHQAAIGTLKQLADSGEVVAPNHIVQEARHTGEIPMITAGQPAPEALPPGPAPAEMLPPPVEAAPERQDASV